MPTDAVTIIGAGGHACVVADALRRMLPDARISICDHHPEKAGSSILGLTVSRFDAWDAVDDAVHVAVGDNGARQRLSLEARDAGKQLISVVHPGAHVSSEAEIEGGSFLAAGSIVAPRALVEIGAIVNHNAIVDHDVAIRAFVHIAPGATLGGGVTVAEGAMIGAGATVLPGRQIGPGATVGAGAVVVKDVPANSVVVGVPAGETAVD